MRKFESEMGMDDEKMDSFSLHMVLYKDAKAVTAHNFFSIKLSMLYGVRIKMNSL